MSGEDLLAENIKLHTRIEELEQELEITRKEVIKYRSQLGLKTKKYNIEKLREKL